MKKFKVDVQWANSRADVFLAARFPRFSRSALEGLFDAGLVTINSRPAKSGQRLRPKDTLEIDSSPLEAKPPHTNLPIIFEDDDVIVIDKPSGLLTHSKGALNSEATVASFIEPKLNDPDLTGNRAGIVHRLDRQTSGVIIAAKNQKALGYLQKQFSSRKTKKTYLALVEGVPKEPRAIVDAPIGRNPKKPQTFKVTSKGKSALTEYKVIRTYNGNKSDFSLVELKPLTGRTHQLRVHMSYIGNPVIGDEVYGRRSTHMMLHAYSLSLRLPNGSERTFEAEPPEYFTEYQGPEK